MRRLATLAVVAALLSPTAASGQNYTFGDWARNHGYSPGDVMPERVNAETSSVDSLDGIDDFDWTATPTEVLWLSFNRLSSVESGAFSGLPELDVLGLNDNEISSIDSGAFSGLASLTTLELGNKQLSSIESGTFSGLTNLTELNLSGNQLSSIEPGVFVGLAKLEVLNMGGWLDGGGNQLSSVESGDFSGLTNLTTLNLSNNPLSNIESGAFSGLTNLTTLNLRFVGNLAELNLAEADFSTIEQQEHIEE